MSVARIVGEMGRTVREALLIALVASGIALTVNGVRAHGLRLVARGEFEILVPCPEPSGSAAAIQASDPRLRDVKTLLVDARPPEDYMAWHWTSALNVPFDWLAEHDRIELDARDLARRIARTGKHAVVVYGDGDDPDSGQQWALLLSAAGIRNVAYVQGGCPALRRAVARQEHTP